MGHRQGTQKKKILELWKRLINQWLKKWDREKEWTLAIPQDGFESIQYSKPWSWSIAGWLISSGFGAGAAMAHTHFTSSLSFCLQIQMGIHKMNANNKILLNESMREKEKRRESQRK